jgi:DNA topoisomerase-1
VLWHKKIPLHPVVRQNLEELIQEARPSNSTGNGKSHPTRDRPQIFPRIGSSDVNTYLSEILPGLTAKVFRTHHATQVVRESLTASDVEAGDPEYKKWGAISQANIEAAVLCNHSKKGPANWQERRQRARERQEKLKERVARYRTQVREARDKLKALRREGREKSKAARTDTQRDRVRERYAKKLERAEKRIETARGRLERALAAQGKARTKDDIAAQKRIWNLGTSLKSYIDPRVVYQWGQEVDYDVLERYYPKALRRKYAWVRDQEPAEDTQESHAQESDAA